MPISTYQAGIWKAIKGLFIAPTAASAYGNAKTAWIYDGSNWKITYPNYPLNTILPVITGTVAYSNTVSVDPGTWNSDSVYAVTPSTNFAYQWLRDGVAISGATTKDYTCVSADIGKNLSCQVTAANGRGSTPVVTTSQLVVPKITVTPKFTEATLTPGTPSSLTGTKGTNPYDWSLTFAIGLNTSSVAVTEPTVGGTVTYTSPNLTASGNSNGTAPAVVTVTSTNSACKATIDGYTAIGPTGTITYSLQLDTNAAITGITATTYDFTNIAPGSHTVKVTPYYNSTPGISSSVTFTSTATTASANTSIVVKELGKISTVTVSNGTATPGAITGASLTEGSDQSWSAAWTNGSNTTGVSLSTGTGSGTPPTSASGTATGGSVSLDITPTNSSKILTATWTKVVGATKYYARIDSQTEIDIGDVSTVDYSVSDTSNHTVTITPYAGTFRGQSTQSAAASAANVTGTLKTLSGSWSVIGSLSPSADVSPGITTVSWSNTGQAQGSYSISLPGTTLDGSTGFATQTRSFTSVGGTSYALSVTIYKSSNRTGGSTTASTSFKAVFPKPNAPGTPTLTYVSSNVSSYNYKATWTAASGGKTPYSYYLLATPLSTLGGASNTTKGPFSTISNVAFTLPKTSGAWSVQAYAIDANSQQSDYSGASGYA